MKIESNIEYINEELILIENIFKENIKDKYINLKIYIVVESDNRNVKIQLFCNDKLKIKNNFNFELRDNEKISKYEKKFAKIVLYKFLSKKIKYKAPWGSLTGIRPTKLYYELLAKNQGNKAKVNNILANEYMVSKAKINKISQIIKEQEGIVYDHKSIDLYINIPFCVSKCYYCSFISLPLDKCKNLVNPYVDALLKEIKETLRFLKVNKISINTIYVGGGTPTAIGKENLKRILEILPKEIKEFTVEAGRPDTIDEDMLEMLYKQNVTRISINPQTFNDATLKLIGRNHTSNDVYDVFEKARKYPFSINMDLIAGLGEENFSVFKNSLNKAINLNPDNITVHTLSIKKASDLNDVGGKTSSVKEVEKMVKYSYKTLLKNKYNPYYLYRQKNMLGNLENIGYSKNKKICEFNINSMEETLSVIACGANAISKKIEYDINKITRHANVKNIQEYIDRIDEMIKKKLDLFSK